ncbi:hypothetical protein MKEN_00003800 [Mycena kentingensis (nom. inval.)]|nr:hypothetical protein MKEN_00003800 [Mycena kentingensis (nom. inval.)]
MHEYGVFHLDDRTTAFESSLLRTKALESPARKQPASRPPDPHPPGARSLVGAAQRATKCSFLLPGVGPSPGNGPRGQRVVPTESAVGEIQTRLAAAIPTGSDSDDDDDIRISAPSFKLSSSARSPYASLAPSPAADSSPASYLNEPVRLLTPSWHAFNLDHIRIAIRLTVVVRHKILHMNTPPFHRLRRRQRLRHLHTRDNVDIGTDNCAPTLITPSGRYKSVLSVHPPRRHAPNEYIHPCIARALPPPLQARQTNVWGGYFDQDQDHRPVSVSTMDNDPRSLLGGGDSDDEPEPLLSAQSRQCPRLFPIRL